MIPVKNKALILNRIPLIGILIFSLLYVHSATLYPGGSQADINSKGFDWINNYWCNLMNTKGMNGAINPARPIAISAMVILCFSLTVFYIQFAQLFTTNKYWNGIIKIGGTLSMLFAALLFTPCHDAFTIVSSFFGLFVVIGIIKEIYQSNLIWYKASGTFCAFLLILNNYIYYSTHFLEWLPMLQKITFLIVLVWIIGLNNEIRKKIWTTL